MLPKRVYAKINLDNIKKNIESVVKKFSKATVMGIVKADAYGHGAPQTALAMKEAGAGAFGVATVGEAVQLRRCGITEPVLILGPVFKEDYRRAIENGITCTVFDVQPAKELSVAAESMGTRAKVFIKIDTGMGRIGFQPDSEGFEQVKSVFSNKALEIMGAFTHFACADSVDKTSALAQKSKFIEFTDRLIAEGFPLPVRHMYNSASIMELDGGYTGEMVRCGVMAYGLYPSEEVKREYRLYPAMELKSSIAFIKDVGKDFTVSYGSTYRTDKPAKIATIPVGYGDGYPRYLSNRGEVLIKGIRCPIVGRVCMDQFMVDISAVPGAVIGDEVTLIGSDSGETITVEDIADPAYRFNYEFCCLITGRVPRVYVKDGKIIKIQDPYA